MTDELRQRANTLHRQIGDIRAQVQIVESMHHCDNDIIITCDEVGSITIAYDDELKDDIIDIVLRNLNKQEEEAEDEYRRL